MPLPTWNIIPAMDGAASRSNPVPPSQVLVENQSMEFSSTLLSRDSDNDGFRFSFDAVFFFDASEFPNLIASSPPDYFYSANTPPTARANFTAEVKGPDGQILFLQTGSFKLEMLTQRNNYFWDTVETSGAVTTTIFDGAMLSSPETVEFVAIRVKQSSTQYFVGTLATPSLPDYKLAITRIPGVEYFPTFRVYPGYASPLYKIALPYGSVFKFNLTQDHASPLTPDARYDSARLQYPPAWNDLYTSTKASSHVSHSGAIFSARLKNFDTQIYKTSGASSERVLLGKISNTSNPRLLQARDSHRLWCLAQRLDPTTRRGGLWKFFYSDQNARANSFQETGMAPFDATHQHVEPCFVGSLLCVIGVDLGNNLKFRKSSDNAASWSNVYTIATLPSAQPCQIRAQTISGRIALVVSNKDLSQQWKSLNLGRSWTPF